MYLRQSSENSGPRTSLVSVYVNYTPESVHDAKMDTWGLGVTLTELLAWLAGGPQALEDLKETCASGSQEVRDDRSFEKGPGLPETFRLKTRIIQWFNSMISSLMSRRDRDLRLFKRRSFDSICSP